VSEFIIDPIEMGKVMQYELEFIEDPVEAAFKGNESAHTLNQVHSDLLTEGRYLVVRSLGGFVFGHWHPESGQYVSIRYEEQIVATGKYDGKFGFIQNINNPRIQTLFVALRGARVLESTRGLLHNTDELAADMVAEKLVLPLLEVETLQAA
jgi:hypothetical protein